MVFQEILNMLDSLSDAERVLFIRCDNDAIAFTGYTKKVNWGKKEQAALDASENLAIVVANECRSNRT